MSHFVRTFCDIIAICNGLEPGGSTMKMKSHAGVQCLSAKVVGGWGKIDVWVSGSVRLGHESQNGQTTINEASTSNHARY